MINNNSCLTDISLRDAIESGLFYSKLELFNRLNPDIQCSDWMYDDWEFDFCKSKWDLYFIRWDRTEKGKVFQKTMGYWKPFIEPGVSDNNKEVKRADEIIIKSPHGIYVEKWNQDNRAFELLHRDPTTPAYQNHSGFSKCSLKRNEASVICYGDFERFPKDRIDIDIKLFEELMNKTHKLLLEKCNSLIQTATQRKFKKGWVFHKMKEDYLAIDKLWKPHGFYYKISDDVAGSYSYKYNSIHPNDVEKAKREWDYLL